LFVYGTDLSNKFWGKDVPSEGTLEHTKRIIAIGGDTIQGKKDGVYLNGELLNEPYAKYGPPDTSDERAMVFGPIKVAPAQYFVMGDNRDNSWDSRYHGTVLRSRIEGCPLYVYGAHDRSRIGQVIR
jgi:signal peptidase I